MNGIASSSKSESSESIYISSGIFLYGELLYIFIDPSVRNKLLLDDLFARMETWFLDNNCLFMQASVMAYTDEWACQEQYVDKARDYFFKRGKMKEVGYHYIKPIGRDSWAE